MKNILSALVLTIGLFTSLHANELAKMKLGCDMGNITKCIKLGDMYNLGIETEVDKANATKYYQDACTMGYREGCDKVALIKKKQITSSPAYAVESSNVMSSRSYYQLGDKYKKNIDKSIGFYKKACDAGSAAGCVVLGSIYEKKKNKTNKVNAVKVYMKACSTGSGLACSKLGDIYLKGKGVAPDRIQAAKYFFESEIKQYYSRDKQFADLCTKSDDNIKFRDEAFDIARECGNGDTQKCADLGFISLNGIGIEKSFKVARKSYLIGCDKGIGESCYWLSTLYTIDNDVVQMNYPKAIELQKKSCSLGYEEGCHRLAGSYMRGFYNKHYGGGVRKDIQKGLSLQHTACSNNNANACYSLGNIYERQPDVANTDYNKAVEFYTKACDLGQQNACQSLGNLYFFDKTTFRDYETANFLYKEACLLGSDQACNQVDTKKFFDEI